MNIFEIVQLAYRYTASDKCETQVPKVKKCSLSVRVHSPDRSWDLFLSKYFTNAAEE